MPLGQLPPWLTIHPSDFVAAAQQGAAQGIQIAHMNNQAQQAAREQEQRRWEIEQRAIANAKAHEFEKQQYQDALAQRYDLAMKALDWKNTQETQREALKREEDAARNDRSYANMGLKSEIANMYDDTRRAAIAKPPNVSTFDVQKRLLLNKYSANNAVIKSTNSKLQTGGDFLDGLQKAQMMDTIDKARKENQMIEAQAKSMAVQPQGNPAGGTSTRNVFNPKTGKVDVVQSDEAQTVIPTDYNPTENPEGQ